MKAFAILPVAAAAIMAFNISTASSQGGCQQEFQACMGSCATRSAKALQDSCFNSCESKNNMCAERVYGKRPFSGTPTTAAGHKGQAKDALAKTEKAPAPQAQPSEQPAEQERAPQPDKAPVAPQRGQPRR